jgi:S1-C subfamily serine protease
MMRRQLAVPVVAALLGGAVTAAALTATNTGTSTGPRQQGLLTSSGGEELLTVREIFDRSAPSVVAIRASAVRAAPFESARTAAAPGDAFSTGSGFVLDDDGHIVTSARVVSGVTDVHVTFADLRVLPAKVVGKDEETDLAVLWVDPQEADLRPLELGDSAAVHPGDKAVAIANPLGSGATAGTGRVAAARSRVETPGGVVLRDVIETDALVEPATAGGPVMGSDGRVIGITSGISPGYAVASNTAKDVLAQLKTNHKLIRPYLGIRGRTTREGVLLLSVYPGGPAAQAGLQGTDSGGGDVIEAIDGRAVTALTDLLAEVDRRTPGETVRLTVLRNGSRGDVEVTLMERPASLPAG